LIDVQLLLIFKYPLRLSASARSDFFALWGFFFPRRRRGAEDLFFKGIDTVVVVVCIVAWLVFSWFLF
jgi:hypothetical protein